MFCYAAIALLFYLVIRKIGVLPATTEPVNLLNSFISSMLEITTGDKVDFAFSSRIARLNSIIESPTST
jgi:hypothetical protein